jgi:hypothetical protein
VPRIPLVQDENLLDAVIHLAVSDAARKQLATNPGQFKTAHGLTAAQMTLLQPLDANNLQRHIVNVQTTNP